MTSIVRNPEGVDFRAHPIPAGFVVASEKDLKKVKVPRRGWLLLAEVKNKWAWRKCGGSWFRNGWTYLRPMTSKDRAR